MSLNTQLTKEVQSTVGELSHAPSRSVHIHTLRTYQDIIIIIKTKVI